MEPRTKESNYYSIEKRPYTSNIEHPTSTVLSILQPNFFFTYIQVKRLLFQLYRDSLLEVMGVGILVLMIRRDLSWIWGNTISNSI